MSKMSELDTVVSDLRNAAATINSVADTLFELFGGKRIVGYAVRAQFPFRFQMPSCSCRSRLQ